jgi:uncharacterized 2Fe-2S/4Fe-4S cluster protein (DUF4445 family)
VPFINFVNQNKSVFAENGSTILDAARSVDIRIESPCNALGSCGKCKVKIARADNAASVAETENGFVLACQTVPSTDIQVWVKDYDEENRSLRILSEGDSFSYTNVPFITKNLAATEQPRCRTEVYGGGKLIGIENGNTLDAVYAIALDIGTTTMAAALIDLRTGVPLDSIAMLNPQAAYAQDVLSRIHFASKPDGLAALHNWFIAALNSMIAALAEQNNVSKANIYEIVFSGNTTMLHLAAGTNPYSLGQYPYTPRIWGGNYVASRVLGIAIAQFGLVYLPPIVSAYVGADITSSILVSRLDEAAGATLFIDIGTNGEIALARDGVIAVASTAAGPAFEGMNISCGMRANNGAIESFRIDSAGNIAFDVIGGVQPAGICGSGLLDIAGELVRCGVIGTSGRFVSPKTGNYGDFLKERLQEKDGEVIFSIAPGVYLSQKDVRQIQLAKSAIYSGIEILLSHFKISAAEVDTVEIAGSFGYHLHESSLISIGLLPDVFAGKIRFIGNTSLSGAKAFLLNTGFREKTRNLVKRISTIDLGKDSNFEKVFIENMVFHHAGRSF